MLSNLRAENDKLRQDKEREQRHIDYSEYTQKQKQHEYLNELRVELEIIDDCRRRGETYAPTKEELKKRHKLMDKLSTKSREIYSKEFSYAQKMPDLITWLIGRDKPITNKIELMHDLKSNGWAYIFGLLILNTMFFQFAPLAFLFN